VPSATTSRIRELSRGRCRKTDGIDAAAAVSAAALGGEARPVAAQDLTTLLALLNEHCDNITTPDQAG
jgi:transposase